MGSRWPRERRAMGTPKFAVHPEGYNPKAADAKPADGAAPAAQVPAGRMFDHRNRNLAGFCSSLAQLRRSFEQRS